MKTFHFDVKGERGAARAAVVAQADSLILAGSATPEVKVAALALIDALPGTQFEGAIDGHFDDPLDLSPGATPRYNITCMVSSF